ncbi:YjjW family glycine radical enzyme activase [Marinifilum sp. N1E240]|uniref:YjjW family glycine radical enzyme activase n=1 Tax=Marinifilum sp. N1E240 TaxID=2608082 RepID=UPI00128DA939|nr:YjjW family glycine radical enzyme activase [Marinifilum sp. N1E240]MPQ46959.1 YjjW family glycine radical enzyme activase [Marinifilum sp. N1E240]
MSKLRANISDIIKSSVIDGPGNRMVIFFQACNLNCMYCHNSHTIGLCNLCGTCVKACPTCSLKLDADNKKLVHNSETCIRCDKCLKVCPQNSSPFYKSMSVDDILSEILEVKDFISGITVSGGEVMLQSLFLKQLFTGIKEHSDLQNLSILVDSNGNINRDKWTPLLHLTDGFMIDLKAYSSEIHKKITGYSNEKILNSIHYLNEQDKLTELRFVLVPEYNDNAYEIEGIAEMMNSVSPDVRKVLIKLRNHGIRSQYNHLSEPSHSEAENIRKQFENSGVSIQVI